MDLLTPTLIGILLIIISLLCYWITVFIIFYHLIRFGVGTQPKKIALLFLLGAIGFFFVSVALFMSVDWVIVWNEIGKILQTIFNKPYLP